MNKLDKNYFCFCLLIVFLVNEFFILEIKKHETNMWNYLEVVLKELINKYGRLDYGCK